MLRNTWAAPLVWWAWGAIITTGLCGLVSLSVQQNYRQGANDPQIQLAEDGVVPSGTVDIGSSLAPWLVVYDKNGQPLSGNGYLNGTLPTLPPGVFAAARSGQGKDTAMAGEDRITWQPTPAVRQAVVVVATKDGYVAAGRSLREVEVREGDLTFQIVVAWAVTLGVLLVGSYVAWFLLR